MTNEEKKDVLDSIRFWDAKRKEMEGLAEKAEKEGDDGIAETRHRLASSDTSCMLALAALAANLNIDRGEIKDAMGEKACLLSCLEKKGE